MSSEIGWDQQIFNEEAMFPAHGDSTTGLVSIRILDFIRFINSKTFFKSERHRFIPGSTDPRIQAEDTLPVRVHMVGEGEGDIYHASLLFTRLCVRTRVNIHVPLIKANA